MGYGGDAVQRAEPSHSPRHNNLVRPLPISTALHWECGGSRSNAAGSVLHRLLRALRVCRPVEDSANPWQDIRQQIERSMDPATIAKQTFKPKVAAGVRARAVSGVCEGGG